MQMVRPFVLQERQELSGWAGIFPLAGKIPATHCSPALQAETGNCAFRMLIIVGLSCLNNSALYDAQ